jgi:hypothetical protein
MLLHNFNPTLIASFNIVNNGLRNLKDRFGALPSRATPLTLKNWSMTRAIFIFELLH